MAQDFHAAPGPLSIGPEAYRLLFDANPNPMLLFEIGSWRILAANPAASLLYGWSTDELAGRTIVDLKPAEDRDRFRQVAAQVPPGVTRLGRTTHVARDGRSLHVDITTAALTLDDGRPARLSVITDVTGEHALLEARDRLAAVVAGSSDAIIVTDLRGRVQSWNPGAEGVFGYTQEEMLGRSIGEIHPPADGPSFRERAADVVAGRVIRMFDAVGRHKAGHDITLSMTLSPICDAAGKVVGISGIERDVTERRASEQTLRESQARFVRVFQSVLIIAAVLDVKAQTLRDVNDSWLRFFGMKRHEIVGATVHDYPEMWLDLAQRSALFASWEARAPLQAVEVGFQTRTGPKHALLSVLYADEAGEDIVLMLDITERRRLEAQLSEARRLEAIGRLAGGVAHDFNNMLSVVGGYADLLEEQMPKDSPWAADLGEIKRAADRAAHLTRQLLAFGRRQMLQPRTIDLNDVVRRNETFLGRVLGDGITLRLILCSEPLWVEADTVQIEQVLLNLATNARDAIDGAGVLQIATKPRMLARGWAQERGLASGRVAEIAVRDTGRGMGADTLQRIFEPFFTTKEVGEGTGLGLATVYGIVKQSGGHIDAASTPGQGTLFRILLPLVDEADGAPEAAAEEKLEGGSETILVVEDEESLRTMLGDILRMNNYQVLEAGDGEEALLVYQKRGEPIQLLLTDVVMPRMNGRALAERLTQTEPGLKVLFISGYPNDSALRQSLSGEGAPFLQKPFNPQTLTDKVRALLDA
ncbi:MAG: PAS domain S-box protein [Acidobacteria bacterium]|nr:PAS domain S-box protein [Acidobacteriota bacterium]